MARDHRRRKNRPRGPRQGAIHLGDGAAVCGAELSEEAIERGRLTEIFEHVTCRGCIAMHSSAIDDAGARVTGCLCQHVPGDTVCPVHGEGIE